jgi:hypothetical protein
MHAFYAEPNAIKQDELAARQLRVNRAWLTQKGAAMIDTARRALELLTRR